MIFKKSKYIKFSHNYNDISDANIKIIYLLNKLTLTKKSTKPDLTIIKKSLKTLTCFFKKK